MTKHNLDDNITKVLLEFMRTFRWPLSLAMVALVFYLGWLDVPGFKAIVDGVVAILREAPGFFGV